MRILVIVNSYNAGTVVALFENLPYKKRHWYPWKVPYEMMCPETRDIADIEV